jgi:hypothetical protein
MTSVELKKNARRKLATQNRDLRSRPGIAKIAGTIFGAPRNTRAFAALLPERRWTTPVTGLGEFDSRGPQFFKQSGQGNKKDIIQEGQKQMQITNRVS